MGHDDDDRRDSAETRLARTVRANLSTLVASSRVIYRTVARRPRPAAALEPLRSTPRKGVMSMRSWRLVVFRIRLARRTASDRQLLMRRSARMVALREVLRCHTVEF